MKNITFIAFLFVLISCSEQESPDWNLADAPLYTQWAAKVNPGGSWQEYPRPQLTRSEWLNLNGLWDFAITDNDSIPLNYDSKILVPFPVESALSGIGKRVDAGQKLWYRKEFTVPSSWRGKRTLLHFEASDWETLVWIDEKEAGAHRGGYDPFTFDITDFVKPGKAHTLKISVWDPTDKGYQPRGKQVSNPNGIWYTPSSGIWQTVWMEPVPDSYIESYKVVTDIDHEQIILEFSIRNPKPNANLEVEVLKEGRSLYTGLSAPGQRMEIPMPGPEIWSPDHPFLYDITLRLLYDKEIHDEVVSYFGMRKISIVKDENGFNRLALNNEILFLNGPLDQGFWPDGLNTPPSDEAMKFDLEATRAMGFNMLRKHVKVENRRFYHWCDRLGLLVWQDMPSAAGYVSPDGDDLQPSEEHKLQFEKELKALILDHYNHPSIIMWIPFNEGWGQYDTRRIADLVKTLDSTRLVNNASGWTDRGAGDVIDIHHYPSPACPKPEENRASVLGEFGGLGLYVEGHTWQQENWGYEKMQAVDELLTKYEDYYRAIDDLKKSCGLAAVVYTQTTDVETETNGLMTYDRYHVKMGMDNIRKAHLGITPPRIKTPLREFIEKVDVELITEATVAVMQYSLSEPGKDNVWTDYSETFEMTDSFVIKTRNVFPDGTQSRENTFAFRKVDPLPAVNMEVKPGLKVSEYKGNWEKLPDFGQLQPEKNGISEKVDLEFSDTTALFGMVFEGYLEVPETDVYLFNLSSDDGARMYLNGEVLIDYDGIHGAGYRKASAALGKGLHSFRLVYFQRFGGQGLSLFWESRKMEYREISPGNWKH